MNALNTYIDALQQVADKPGLIITGDDPLCDTLVLLSKAGLITGNPVGKPDYLTRIEKCHITPNGALALFQWKHEVASRTFFNRAQAPIFSVLLVILGVLIEEYL